MTRAQTVRWIDFSNNNPATAQAKTRCRRGSSSGLALRTASNKVSYRLRLSDMGFPPGVVFWLATLLHPTRRSSCSAAFSHVSVNQGVRVFRCSGVGAYRDAGIETP